MAFILRSQTPNRWRSGSSIGTSPACVWRLRDSEIPARAMSESVDRRPRSPGDPRTRCLSDRRQSPSSRASREREHGGAAAAGQMPRLTERWRSIRMYRPSPVPTASGLVDFPVERWFARPQNRPASSLFATRRNASHAITGQPSCVEASTSARHGAEWSPSSSGNTDTRFRLAGDYALSGPESNRLDRVSVAAQSPRRSAGPRCMGRRHRVDARRRPTSSPVSAYRNSRRRLVEPGSSGITWRSRTGRRRERRSTRPGPATELESSGRCAPGSGSSSIAQGGSGGAAWWRRSSLPPSAHRRAMRSPRCDGHVPGR